MARRGSSSQDILKSIENFKENLNRIQNEKLSSQIISQLTNVQSTIETLITEQSRKSISEDEESHSPVNCQLCFQEQKNLSTLREHLKTACQAINDPNLKEGKKTSAFQILTSNSIKCNICESYFDDFQEMLQHRQSEKHKSSTKKKNIHYSKFLYCPVCQINVPDNIIQFQNHVRNEIHIDRCIEMRKLKGDDTPRNVLLKDGILYLWRSENTCKCLVCNSEFEMTSNQMEIHRNNSNHIKNLKESDIKFESDCLKCLVCDDLIIGLIPILLHLQSPGHIQKAKTAKQPKSPVTVRPCLFCNVECENILALAKHQRKDCSGLKEEPTSKALKKNIFDDVVKNDNYSFVCKLCNLETDDKQIFQDHIQSEDHTVQKEKFVHAGFGVVQNVCELCPLLYIGSQSFVDRHNNEHKEEMARNTSQERGRSPKKEKNQARAKSAVRDKSPNEEKFPARAKSVAREKSPKKEKSITGPKNLKTDKSKTSNCNEVPGVSASTVQQPKSSVSTKSEHVKPVFISGFTEVPSLKNLKKILGVFGEIKFAEFQPNGDLCVYYGTNASAEKILSIKEFKAGNNRVKVSKEATPLNHQKSKKTEISALDELVATLKGSLLETATAKPLLSDLYPCTDFDKKFLANPKTIVECGQVLCKASDSFNNRHKNNDIGEICKNILGCSSFQIFGSRAYALNMKDCCLDIFVTYPNFKIDNNPLYNLIEKSLLQQFSESLEKDVRFDNVKLVDNDLIGPLISCRKVDCKVQCLISFKNQLVIEKTEILKNQIEMDPRVRQLLLLIKTWAHDKKLIAQDKFSTYSLFMMVIFFLQKDDVKVLPKYSQMTVSPFLRNLFMKIGINPASGEFTTKNTSSVPELFIKFFQFYLSFDYKQAISLPFCKAVSKTTLSSDPAVRNSFICIMDVLEPKINLTKNVSEATMNEFFGYGQSLLKPFLIT